jgi:four helix bundle protein
MKKDNIIADKTFQFSLSIIAFYQQLLSHKEYVISKQLLRSGTSIGANVEESLAAQSRSDFIHKMSLASKEARETKYWLKLLNESSLTNLPVDNLLTEINDIINILTKIILSSKKASD